VSARTLFNIVFYGDLVQGRKPIKQNWPGGPDPIAKRFGIGTGKSSVSAQIITEIENQ
jgi:hypothetical protein